jgi:hypothetical protein
MGLMVRSKTSNLFLLLISSILIVTIEVIIRTYGIFVAVYLFLLGGLVVLFLIGFIISKIAILIANQINRLRWGAKKS